LFRGRNPVKILSKIVVVKANPRAATNMAMTLNESKNKPCLVEK
jgi:hypothetical protein